MGEKHKLVLLVEFLFSKKICIEVIFVLKALAIVLYFRLFMIDKLGAGISLKLTLKILS